MNINRRHLLRAAELLAKILSLVFTVSVLYGFDEICVVHLTLISTAVHELGHMFCALLLGCGVGLPRSVIGGFRIKLRHSVSYREELAVLAAGPGANLALCAIIMLAGGWRCEYTRTLAVISLSTALSNLLPLDGFDGYRIIRLLLEMYSTNGGESKCKSKHKNTEKKQSVRQRLPSLAAAERAMDALSLLCCAMLTFASLYLILRFDGGYWFFAMFFTMMLSKTAKISKNTIF